MKKSFSISLKIYTGISLLLLGYCISMAFFAISGHKAQLQMFRITELHFPASTLSKEAQDEFLHERKNFDDALLASDPSKVEQALNRHNNAVSALERLTVLALPEEERAEINEILVELKDYTRDAVDAYSLWAKGGSVPKSTFSGLSARSVEISDELYSLVECYDARMKEEIGLHGKSFDRVRRISIAILIFVVVPAVLLMVFILAGVIRRINKIAKRIRYISDGDGQIDVKLAGSMANPVDTETRVESTFDDELTQLAGSFDTMLTALYRSFTDQQELLETLRDRNLSLAAADAELKTRLDETIKLQKELEELNGSLETRISEELAKNREKDLMMIHQSRLAVLGEMLSNIAHQWRQPLHELSCMIQMLSLDLPPESRGLPAVSEFSERGMEIIKFMSRTIEDFRNFFVPSRKPEVFDVRDAVSGSISLVSTSFKSSGIEVECDCETGCLIYGHCSEISQVLLNIINNSRDALIQKRVEAPKISICCLLKDGIVCVRIADNAGGIPDEVIDRIFEPYFTTKEKSKGTGLGLYMSRMIIERNGNGTLSVENGPEGAIFTIMLPASKEGAEIE